MLYLCISETYSYITTYYMYLLQIRGECVCVCLLNVKFYEKKGVLNVNLNSYLLLS